MYISSRNDLWNEIEAIIDETDEEEYQRVLRALQSDMVEWAWENLAGAAEIEDEAFRRAVLGLAIFGRAFETAHGGLIEEGGRFNFLGGLQRETGRLRPCCSNMRGLWPFCDRSC